MRPTVAALAHKQKGRLAAALYLGLPMVLSAFRRALAKCHKKTPRFRAGFL